MRRRGTTSDITVRDVPDWVLSFDAERHRDVDPGPQNLYEAAWSEGMLWAIAAHRAHRDEASAWREQHAPHLSWRELDAEKRRRLPVVYPAAR